MKFAFRSLVVTTASSLARQLKEHLTGLGALIAIESAEAVLERISDSKGAFRLQVHLAVPGPDLRVESTGYTAQEAMLKMKKELMRQIQIRQSPRRDQRNTRRPLVSGR